MSEELPAEERYEKELQRKAEWENADYERALLFTLEVTDKQFFRKY